MKSILIIALGVLCFYAYAQDVNVDGSIVRKGEEHYNKGRKYSQEGNYYKANEEFKKAEELLAKNKDSRGNGNGFYAKSGRASDNKRTNKAGVNSKIEDILRKAKNVSSNDNGNEAVKYYLELLTLVPGNPDVYYNLGVEYLKRRDYFDATQEFMQALKLNPKDADSCYNLAILYEVFMHDKGMASVYYKRYLKLRPDAPDNGVVRGWIDSLGSYNE